MGSAIFVPKILRKLCTETPIFQFLAFLWDFLIASNPQVTIQIGPIKGCH